MTKIKRTVLCLTLAATSALAVGALASCGGDGDEPAAKVETTGVYLSDNGISYMNFTPNYNYFICTMSGQQIETYSDGTYALTITSITYSNITTGANVPTEEFTANDKGQTVTVYYGTFTSTPDGEDLTLALSAPTRATYIVAGNEIMDSAVTYGEDKTYKPLGANEDITYNDYIKSVKEKFTGADVLINGTKKTFSKVEIK